MFCLYAQDLCIVDARFHSLSTSPLSCYLPASFAMYIYDIRYKLRQIFMDCI